MRTAKILSLLCFFILSSNISYSLKPSPFKNSDNINLSVGEDKFKLSSIRKIKDSYSTEGTTSLTDKKGKTLWKINTFIGRRDYLVSPNGEILILIGNIYFGAYKNREDGLSTEVIIYRNGKEIRKITLVDLYEKKMAEVIKSNKIRRYGGGWVATKGLIKKIDMDWSKNELRFNLIGMVKVYIFDWN